jgi:hypothetical protein
MMRRSIRRNGLGAPPIKLPAITVASDDGGQIVYQDQGPPLAAYRPQPLPVKQAGFPVWVWPVGIGLAWYFFRKR